MLSSSIIRAAFGQLPDVPQFLLLICDAGLRNAVDEQDLLRNSVFRMMLCREHLEWSCHARYAIPADARLTTSASGRSPIVVLDADHGALLHPRIARSDLDLKDEDPLARLDHS